MWQGGRVYLEPRSHESDLVVSSSSATACVACAKWAEALALAQAGWVGGRAGGRVGGWVGRWVGAGKFVKMVGEKGSRLLVLATLG